MDRNASGKTRKLSCKKVEDAKDDTIIISQLSASSCPTSTPIRNTNVETENDDSPCSGFTQDCDDMAVLWDWNSPKVKQKTKRKSRKLDVSSPKPTFKRHPSNNNQQHIFEKLKEEFQALREQIAIPDNEDCLVLSPLEEDKLKDSIRNESALNSLIQEENHNEDKDFEDIFNDSLDDELFLCTQRVEDKLKKVESKNTDKNDMSEPKTNIVLDVDEKLNDSLNRVLEAFEDEDIVLLSQTQQTSRNISKQVKKNFSSCAMRRTCSDVPFQMSRPRTVETESGRVEIFRTHSFEVSRIIDVLVMDDMSPLNKYEQTYRVRWPEAGYVPPDKAEEIERKRLEALARLESKRKKNSEADISPIHCSPEEIEQKRLQAIAKLEAKKQQELEIERKRQEALKRLELNRMKRANTVKSSLEKRL